MYKPIQLIFAEPFEKTECTASRVWGNPALPETMDYPTYVDDEGDDYPYFFLCQINLQELAEVAPDNPLPHKGLLSFFAKIDHYLGYFAASDCISGYISRPDDLKVFYFPGTENFKELILLDDNDEQSSPNEMEIHFSKEFDEYYEDHFLFAEPTHREWESWDHPYEKWEILLQIDSFATSKVNLNFMDCGVLDFLIDPKDLAKQDFSKVRAIVLST